MVYKAFHDKVNSLLFVSLSECSGQQITRNPMNSGINHKDTCLLPVKSLGRQAYAVLDGSIISSRTPLRFSFYSFFFFFLFWSISSFLMVTSWLQQLWTSYSHMIACGVVSKVVVAAGVVAKGHFFLWTSLISKEKLPLGSLVLIRNASCHSMPCIGRQKETAIMGLDQSHVIPWGGALLHEHS